MALLNFDATQVAPDAGQMDAMPAGWYNVMMDESEVKPTKGGDGFYLQCRFNILDGQYVGRKVSTRFNIRNPNPVAQEIAYKQLSAVAHAVGVLHVGDSSELHGRPLKVKVKLKPADGQYEASNEISAYKNINEQVGPAAGAAPAGTGVPAGFGTQAPAPAPAPVAAPAWQQPAAPAPAPVAAPAPAAAPQWQAPQAQQPWQAPAAAPAPAPAPAPVAAPAPAAVAPGTPPAWAGAQNPQTAVPPWAQQPAG